MKTTLRTDITVKDICGGGENHQMTTQATWGSLMINVSLNYCERHRRQSEALLNIIILTL